jgi:hypothetical protein
VSGLFRKSRDKLEQGSLKRYALSRQERINGMLTSLEEQGLYPHEALELMRDEIYLATEEDVPNLGETMQPYTD